MAITLHEVTTVAPDIIRVEIRDGQIQRGSLIQVSPARTEAYGSLFDYNGTPALVVSPDKTWIRTHDEKLTDYLDRSDADMLANWGITGGGRSISAVYRKTVPYDEGRTQSANDSTVLAAQVSMQHFIYLELDGNLANGTDYVIEFPSSTGFSDYTFSFDDRMTRCSSIHVNQLGWRKADSGKYAYFAHWVPFYGTEGRVDLLGDYSGFDTFQVISSLGNYQFGGTIVDKISPTTADPSASMDTDPVVSMVEAARDITDISVSSGVVTVTYTGADPTNGDVVLIRDVVGMTNVNTTSGAPRLYTVANVDTGANTFELSGVDGSAFSAYVSGGKWYPTIAVNASGTYVHEMDFGTFVPAKQGEYRIRIPGLGVSDPFRLGEETWYSLSKVYGEGMFHQRNGIEFTGLFNGVNKDGTEAPYIAPASFDPSSQTVVVSYLPADFWSAEAGGPIPVRAGATATWQTGETYTGLVGGHQDAGDWDGFANHSVLYARSVLVWECLPEEAKDYQYGVPKSSATIGGIYDSSTDSLSDLLHECIWYYDFYRRNQREDGAVIGGIQMGLNASGFIDGFEPSWLTRNGVFIYAPDHKSTFAYAGGAALLASALADRGFTSLAATFEASAVAAFDWAETLYGSSAERDAEYLAAKTIAEAEAYAGFTYSTVISNMQSGAQSERSWASAALYRLTGDTAYRTITDSYTDGSTNDRGIVQTAILALSNHPDAAAKRTSVANLSNSFFDDYTTETANHYRLSAINSVTGTFGSYGTDMRIGMLAHCLAHYFTDSDVHLKRAQIGFNFILGANQSNFSFVTGVGSRWYNTPLHEDSLNAGIPTPKGLGVYAVTRARSFLKATNAFGKASYTAYLSGPDEPSTYQNDYKQNHEITPWMYHFPILESVWQNSRLIEKSEYTIGQNIFPQIAYAAYLWANGGNTQTSQLDEGENDMLVTTSGNAIVTDGSIEQATSIQAGIRITWRGLTLDLPAATYTVTPVI